MAAIPRYGRHPLHVLKGKTNRQLETYLAAAGHNLCTKFVRLYLQSMSSLATDHPDVHRKFEAGFHVVRRINRLWAGLSMDLVMEQVLMRSLKTSGMTDRRVIWLLSMPTCAEMNRAMLELAGVSYSTGEQNKDMTKSRQAWDMKDTRTLLLALTERNPFTTHTDLINIITGVHAESSVNVEKAREVGQSNLDSMTGKAGAEYSFTKSNQALTFIAKSSIKVDVEKIQVDPQLLFQRLIIASQSLDDI